MVLRAIPDAEEIEVTGSPDLDRFRTALRISTLYCLPGFMRHPTLFFFPSFSNFITTAPSSTDTLAVVPRDILTGRNPGVHYYTHNIDNENASSIGPVSGTSPRIDSNALDASRKKGVPHEAEKSKRQKWLLCPCICSFQIDCYKGMIFEMGKSRPGVILLWYHSRPSMMHE